MPAFRYEALDAEGRLRRGLAEGEQARAVRAQLRAQGLVPMSVQAVGAADPGGLPAWARRRAFGPAALALWTRQLAGLVGGGLPLERALAALAEEADGPAARELLAQLRAEVQGGAPFAQALAAHPRDFDPIYRAVVAAGEQGGALGRVLERLADDLERRQALQARILGAVLYPAIVSLIAVAIVIFLVSYVVPQIAGVFEGGRRSLPWLTQALLALSAAVREHGLAALLVLAAGGLGLAAARRRPGPRLRLDAALLRLPLLGRLLRGHGAARFAATLALLAGAGVPILKALQAAADTLGNTALRADAEDTLVQVREGAPLAAALASHPRFPGLLAMFARLGEQTGRLDTMLDRAAEQLGAEVQRRALALATLLEPLLIVGMGGVVMVIVLAILLPIIQLNTWVR